MTTRRRDPSTADRRRLKDGADALAHPEPKTRAELELAISIVADGCAALQSTEDLGTDAENDACWDNMLELQHRLETYVERLKNWKDS